MNEEKKFDAELAIAREALLGALEDVGALEPGEELAGDSAEERKARRATLLAWMKEQGDMPTGLLCRGPECFLDRAMQGDFEDVHAAIDDAVSEWHASDSELSLPAYLGFSDEEYKRWVEHPECLEAIIAENALPS